jgi:glutathione synthase
VSILKHVGVVLDRLEQLIPTIDTTLHLMRVGLGRGYEIHMLYPEDVSVEEEIVYATTRQVVKFNNGIPMVKKWTRKRLDSFDLLLVRKDPPVDMRFTALLTLLTLVEAQVPMINSPTAILSLPEKILPIAFGGVQPPTLVSASLSEILRFKEVHYAVVLKPLYQYRGAGIYVSLAKDRNFKAVVEHRLAAEGLPIVLQKYVPGVAKGDRRVILLGGEPIGALNRMASKTDHRCNMYVGGRASIHRLNKREKRVCRELGGWLVRQGLHFVGVDFIGEFVTEVNTTAPTGITKLEKLGDATLSQSFWQYAEQLATAHHRSKKP